MSVLGVSSYFLWTQKGQTVLPLVRGSGFVLNFKHLNTFYHHHVVTAAHVSCPVKYKSIYGNSVGFKAIGERHISTRLLCPHPESHKVAHSIDLEFKQHFMPNVDVVSLRCKNEAMLADAAVTPLEIDEDPIEDGTEVVYCGVDLKEDRANPNDDGMTMAVKQLTGVCKAAIVSVDYGTVLAGSIEKERRDLSDNAPLLPLSFCGGPVLRKSSESA
ncbi:hypothetical protein AGDE_09571 [Angomonas deanei]|nr:hypothetical protein AGDE_09571 [Angomonas deanei]|eukprot:EPY30184.1 hypothetical protein AGDE_09571 [Angomonas deanei]